MKKKNVILLTIDALRHDHLSCYGYEKIETPNIDMIANEGLLFENVIASSCLTPVAHASILSGKHPNKHKVRDPFTNVSTTLISEILKENGYSTSGYVGVEFLSARRGFAHGFDQFDEPTTDSSWNSKKYKDGDLEEDCLWGNWWVPRMLDWITKNKDKPFFIWGHYFKVHYHAQTELLRTGKIKEGVLSENAYYDAKIKYMDENLFAPLISLLKTLGIWDNTIVIITSDHGESFHFEYPQHRTLYEQDLKIPLIIKDSITGRRKYTVRSIDIAPTIIDLLGIQTKEEFDGRTALTEGNSRLSYSEELYPKRGKGSLQSVRTDDYKIIRNNTLKTEELYNLAKDPTEQEPLSALTKEEFEIFSIFRGLIDLMYKSYKTDKEEARIKRIVKPLKK